MFVRISHSIPGAPGNFGRYPCGHVGPSFLSHGQFWELVKKWSNSCGTTVLDDVFHSPWPMDLDDLSATKHKRDLRLFTSVYHIKSRPIFGVLTHAQNMWDLGGSFSHDKLNRKTKSEDSDSAGWRPGMTCRCSNPIPGIQTNPSYFQFIKRSKYIPPGFRLGR